MFIDIVAGIFPAPLGAECQLNWGTWHSAGARPTMEQGYKHRAPLEHLHLATAFSAKPLETVRRMIDE